MKLRIAAISLIVLVTAPCAAWQDVPEPSDGGPPNSATESIAESAALDAAWSAMDAKKPAEPSKTIRRRGAAPKAEGPGGSKTQSAVSGSWIRSIGSLAAVVAVILFLAWGAKSLTRGGPLAGRAKRPGVIEIISRTVLSPKQSLCLVRVGPRMVLVGITPDSLRTLDVIHEPDAVATLAGDASAARTADAERAFRASLERETVSYEVPAAAAAAVQGDRSGLDDVRQRLSAALQRVKGVARRT